MKNNDVQVINNVDILIENNKIKKISKNIKFKANKVINATNKYVLPGFINCHTHIPMTLFKESGSKYTLQDWLNKFIWPIEAKLTPNDIYYFALLGMIEAINNGVTTINDMYFLTENIIKAANKTKINLINGPTLMDVDGKGEQRLNECKRIINKYGNKNITASIHGLYTASEKYIKTLIPFIKQNKLLVHMHFCENKQEVIDVRKMWKIKTPSDALVKYFSNIKLLLAHCVELSEQDIRNLKKLGCSIVNNPTSNMYLACGVADIKKYLDNNINVCIGTDGPGSGCNGDLLKELRTALLLQKVKYNNAQVINSYDGLKMITINGAKALGIGKNKGSIEVNKDADLLIINLDHLNTMMNNDLISNIVYNVNSDNIETVIINGNIVKDKNKFVDINVNTIINECKKLHAKLMK